MKSVRLILSTTLFILVSCAHHKDVRPGVDGVHRVIIKAEQDEGQREALSQAEHYCQEQNKHAAIVEEKQNYTGKVKEETYQNGKVVSSVLKTVGGVTTVFGGNNERNAGGVGVLAGVATDAALGKGYTVEMSFKCQ